MKTKLTILGCGYSFGVPNLDGNWGKCNKKNVKNHRSRCSALIVKGSNSVLIDTSPDIRKQFIDNKIKNISYVLYTHEHADQTNGIFELRLFYLKKRKKINVFGNNKTINYLKNKFDYCFKYNGSYPPIVKANIIKNKFSLGKGKNKIAFKTIQLLHGHTKSTIYIFEKIAYVSDCNDLSIVNHKELKELKYLIIDCLKIKENWAHFNLYDVLYINSILRPRKTILTNLHTDMDYDYLLKNLPENIIPAYDGLKIYSK